MRLIYRPSIQTLYVLPTNKYKTFSLSLYYRLYFINLILLIYDFSVDNVFVVIIIGKIVFKYKDSQQNRQSLLTFVFLF